jgi:SPX domain protein involved in polyphosphate accumulation
MLLPFAQLDRAAHHFVEGHYTVRSIYFDTPSFEMYHTKRDHLANRQKVRLRGYNHGNKDALVFCEIKRKYEGPIVKNRAKLSYDAVQRIFNGDHLDAFLPQTIKAESDGLRQQLSHHH